MVYIHIIYKAVELLTIIKQRVSGIREAWGIQQTKTVDRRGMELENIQTGTTS
jgi:hypothetical protein